MEGIEVALNGRKINRFYAKKADGDFEAHLVAVGHPKALQDGLIGLLAEKIVEFDYIDSILHETLCHIQKKRNQALGTKRIDNTT